MRTLVHNMYRTVWRIFLGILGTLLGVITRPGWTQTTAQDPDFRCDQTHCVTADNAVLFTEYHDPSKEELSQADTDPTSHPVIQAPVSTLEQVMMRLPEDGRIWISEDPGFGDPELSISAPGQIAYADAHITAPVTFYIRSNYSAFIQHYTLRIYRSTDRDRVHPLATCDIPVTPITHYSWDGQLPGDAIFHPGDQLIYVLQAKDAQGHIDETILQTLQLATPSDIALGVQEQRNTLQKQLGKPIDTTQAQRYLLENAVFSNNNLSIQSIPIVGARVRLQGQNLPENSTLLINEDSYPVDLQGKFAVDYLLPIGEHAFKITLNPADVLPRSQVLSIDVSGKYLFATGIADMTWYHHTAGGPGKSTVADLQHKSVLNDARLAFYLKAKTRGRFLITAQADTQNQPIKYLFNGFTSAHPQDIFRTLDPDLYYPTYGDDSTTWADVDTMGHFYARLDWDKNQILWGNYTTNNADTEYAQYIRALYGISALFRSQTANPWGQPQTVVRMFGAQERSAPGHSEFIGTGGSLYYLHHANILQGSDQVFVELRDPSTGRTEQRFPLLRGADYEIDPILGRILLTKPLTQITRDNFRRITRDIPQDGYEQRLIADYEWVPTGLDTDQRTVGLRAKHWFGDHIGVGLTAVDENRAGRDYILHGADLRLQAYRGTYLNIERSHTESTSVPVYFSDNGGLSFARTNRIAPRQGDATAIEARLNPSELGWINTDWSTGAWWRKRDAGFSIARADTSQTMEQWGLETYGMVDDALALFARYSTLTQGRQRTTQAQATAQWNLGIDDQLIIELRRIQERSPKGGQAIGWLGAARYLHQLNPWLTVYLGPQFTLYDDHRRYAGNNALNLGSQYSPTSQTTLSADFSVGERGNATQITGQYQSTPTHSLYGTLVQSPDRSFLPMSTGNRTTENGWTIGQRWRISNQTNVFNESQFLKHSEETGLTNTLGIDYTPRIGWSLGTTLSKGALDSPFGSVHRQAISAYAGHLTEPAEWQSKLEWRQDRGAQERTQWVSTNRVNYTVNESLRLAGRLNYSKTKDTLQQQAGARFIESVFGFAYRPWNTDRWALFGRYTYLYDLAPLGQRDSDSQFDQNSRILSLEGVYRIGPQWEIAAKTAWRYGRARNDRAQGTWFDSTAQFNALQARYEFLYRWHGILEYRWLNVHSAGSQQGWLIGLDRDVNPHLRFGGGYNFTNFRDDLTDLRAHQRGWYINLIGSY